MYVALKEAANPIVRPAGDCMQADHWDDNRAGGIFSQRGV